MRQSGSTSTTMRIGNTTIPAAQRVACGSYIFLRWSRSCETSPYGAENRHQPYRKTWVVLDVPWSPQDASRYELTIRDSLADSYDTDYVTQHGPWFTQLETAVLLDNLDLRPSDVLVDVGCGTGRITTLLATRCERVIAIDRSVRSLEILNRRIEEGGFRNITTVLADASRSLPTEIQGTRVISVQLLQHIPTLEGRTNTMKNIAQILKPGGRSFVANEMYGLFRRIRGVPQELNGPNILFFHTFTPRELVDLVLGAGLIPLQIRGCGTLYWTRYVGAPRALVKLDRWASHLPGASWFAKFGAIAALKS